MSITRRQIAVLLLLSLFPTGLAVGQASLTQAPQAKAAAYLEEQWRLSGAPAVSKFAPTWMVTPGGRSRRRA